MTTRAFFEFPYEGRNYGNEHEHFQRGGETWFTNKGSGNFTIGLGNGTSPFRHRVGAGAGAGGVGAGGADALSFIPIINSGAAADMLRCGVVFKLNTDVLTSVVFKQTMYYHPNQEAQPIIALTRANVVSKGVSGIVTVTILYFRARARVYFNGELAYSSNARESVPFASGMFQVGTNDISTLEVGVNTEIASVVYFGTDQTSLSHADNSWLPVKDYKVTKLRPVRQVVAEGEEPKFTAQEFDTGFTVHESETIRFETNFEPEEGARHIAIAGHPVRARFVRRGVRYGTATARPHAGNSALAYFDHPTSSGAKALTLLDVGATTYTNLDGHLWLNSSAAEPAQLKTIVIQANITQEPY